jgi:hypothetical protein
VSTKKTCPSVVNRVREGGRQGRGEGGREGGFAAPAQVEGLPAGQKMDVFQGTREGGKRRRREGGKGGREGRAEGGGGGESERREDP